MKLYTFRLRPNQDLRQSLQLFAKQNNIQAGFIVTCVGALRVVVMRMAGATPKHQIVNTYKGKFEIVSLVGTVSAEDCHFHIALSRENGEVIGGHLKDGSIVDVTAEVVVGEDEAVVYARTMDNETGFEELEVRAK
jgi:uncharacterized protein